MDIKVEEKFVLEMNRNEASLLMEYCQNPHENDNEKENELKRNIFNLLKSKLNKPIENDFFSMKIGTKCEGGYFGGIINNNEERYAIIVSPKDLGENQLQFKTSNTADSGIQSTWNGQLNTLNINDDEHPAAHWCSNLNINGYTDWYLPAKDELNLIYNNLKKDFIKDFIRDFYWTSTEHTATTTFAWGQYFYYGFQFYRTKDYYYYVRAIRKVSF
jgi:hypothetical protein